MEQVAGATPGLHPAQGALRIGKEATQGFRVAQGHELRMGGMHIHLLVRTFYIGQVAILRPLRTFLVAAGEVSTRPRPYRKVVSCRAPALAQTQGE